MIEPILENEFHHDGRGPELKRVVWTYEGKILKGFEYYNPEDVYEERNIKNIILEKVEVFSMAGEEVHGSIVANGETKAAIHRIVDSKWKTQFNPRHIADCEHYQIMFYDEIYDVICKSIVASTGRIVGDKKA
ncbi:hypothetical protein CWO84_21905 [Methylomonas sp. Kb3]|uniref:hypothetical protein n=1 Tax=Methylomonas sp. Kb3 TaxID=1611544 RepID=UPI000C32401E|nr:hypothetical protein [Methylomonas sp. Kb3]PKD37911.1 hypothetical protein CWO84_21905 [Methylomonas sp. Kb3]